jgi:hypothetical protein
MNTKFSFSLLVIVIVLVAAVCAPGITSSGAPANLVSQHADRQTPAILPLTGGPVLATSRGGCRDCV